MQYEKPKNAIETSNTAIASNSSSKSKPNGIFSICQDKLKITGLNETCSRVPVPDPYIFLTNPDLTWTMAIRKK
jgi:hypothetical protein